MSRFLVLLAASVCLAPSLAKAQSPVDRYAVQIDVRDGLTKLFSPKIILAAGTTATATKADDLEVEATLTPSQLPGSSAMQAVIVVSKFKLGQWRRVTSSNISLPMGGMAFMKVDPSRPNETPI